MSAILAAKPRTAGFFARLKKSVGRYWMLYLMLIVPLAWVIIFSYRPMYGIQIAFKDFSIRKGYAGSPWVGLKHFKTFMNGFYFATLIKNTVILSLYSILIGFFLPIIFALMLNEIGNSKLQKAVQMITYLPHFISTVVVVSILHQVFSGSGVVNSILISMNFQPVNFFGEASSFRHMYVWSGVWSDLGYSTIIYMAALAKADVELYEAAKIDGANRFQKIRHIDFPTIVPSMTTLLILRFASVMSVGFEKVYLMQDTVNYSVSNVISTYVYEVGLVGGQYSFSTAVGLFNSLINVALLVTANLIVRRISENSLW